MALRISTSHHWAAEDSRGAVIEPIYTKWCPVVFVIPENQLKSISALNTQAIVFFSCFSGLLSTAVAIYISAGFAEKITPVGEMLTKYGAPFSAN